jgi:hypothetical protein
MENQNKKNWFDRYIILTILLGVILFIFIIGILIETTEDNKEVGVFQDVQTQKKQSEYVGKMLKLNSCELDPNNADYWQDQKINFWKDKEKSTISFKLLACDNLELEVIEHDENNGQFKVKHDNQKGWISEMQLIKY